MSYLKKRNVRSRRSGIGDDASQNADIATCLQSANANTAQLDARAAAIAAWQPSGYFQPDDVEKIWMATVSVLNSAADAVSAQLAAINIDTSQDQLRQALDDVHRHAADFAGYRDAVIAARASGGIVNAPGLKTWVVDSFNAASGAIDAAYVVGCTRPTWIQLIQKFLDLVDKLIAILKAVVNAVVTTGKVVINAVEAAPDIAKYLMWAALIGGGLLLAKKMLEMHSSTHAP